MTLEMKSFKFLSCTMSCSENRNIILRRKHSICLITDHKIYGICCTRVVCSILYRNILIVIRRFDFLSEFYCLSTVSQCQNLTIHISMSGNMKFMFSRTTLKLRCLWLITAPYSCIYICRSFRRICRIWLCIYSSS